MRRTGYGGYRGRRTGRDVLKYIIAALAVLVCVLAGILLLGRERPAREEQDPPIEQQQQVTPPVEGELDPEVTPEPAPEPEPEPEPEDYVMRAVGMETAQVLDGSWKRVLEETGANAVVLNMKSDDGALHWETGGAEQEGGINAGLRKLNEAVYGVARISCFRDELLANTYEYCIHSNSGYRWKDFGGIHWVSPANLKVQDYIIDRAVELAGLGFREILLDNCGYPQNGSGEMGWIKRGEVYDLEHLDLVVGAFLERMTRALEPYGVTVSVRTNPTVVQDAMGERTGLTGAVLQQYAQRIWMSEIGTAVPLAEALSEAGVSGVGERLVTQTEVLTPENRWAQAVLSF